MPPKRRERCRYIDEDLIRVIAQTIPGLPPLKPDVAKALAPDAEYRLREVIRRAKSHMRHSKRTYMTVNDILCASKDRERQPVLGHELKQPKTSAFDVVPGMNGLFVQHDQILSLQDVYRTPIPPKTPETRVRAHWLSIEEAEPITNCDIINGTGSNCTENNHESRFDSLIRKAIESSDDRHLDIAIQVLSDTPCSQNQFPSLIKQLVEIVDKNARSSGKSLHLENAARMAGAFAARPIFGAEVYMDELLTLLLTCILGRQLGDGDHWSVRDTAAQALGDTLRVCGNSNAQVRAECTIISALTDSEAPLSSIYGAIVGMAHIGDETFRKHIVPIVPALMTALVHVLQTLQTIDMKGMDLRQEIEEAVFRITYALEEGIEICNQKNKNGISHENDAHAIVGEVTL